MHSLFLLALVFPSLGIYHDLTPSDPRLEKREGMTAHVLALSAEPANLTAAIQSSRFYWANHALGDPAGFFAGASNRLGVYQIGDSVPLAGTTQFNVRVSKPAALKIYCGDKLVGEKQGSQLDAAIPEPASCRAEAWLDDKLWIASAPLHAERLAPDLLRLPSSELAPGVEAVRDLTYTGGPVDDAEKHKLDIIRPAAARNRPVLFFVHGGSWRSGDRKMYPAIGNRFAKEGYVVVLISYRLAPKHKHPAQMEDTAAAFAWTVKNIAEHGGDPKRIFVAGQSAGGHLAATLGLNPQWLAPHDLSPRDIRGVFALSGVYDVTAKSGADLSNVFGTDPDAQRAASGFYHVSRTAPPFLITYCQWDYAFLPQQAVQLHEALIAAGASSELVYVPGEGHITEVLSMVKSGDVTSEAMLRTMRKLEGK